MEDESVACALAIKKGKLTGFGNMTEGNFGEILVDLFTSPSTGETYVQDVQSAQQKFQCRAACPAAMMKSSLDEFALEREEATTVMCKNTC